MAAKSDKLISWLFETKALRVCPQDKPFWYTSGTIGPYYINTHFLYGSEEKANHLLKVIDSEKEDKYTCPQKLLNITKENYENDKIYSGLIDEMCTFIKDNISLEDIDCISGGERRDWFFSLIIAQKLGKPHITIYKDLTTVISYNDKVEELTDLKGKKILHIADLITEASSYERAWIPAIKEKNGILKWSVVVVDRKQGGEELLSRYDVKSYSMVDIDKKLFDNALSMNLINNEQYSMILNYIENPKEAMKKFLEQHPEFLTNALAADEKTKERAKLCIEKNIYDLNI
ncbi:MAG: orotate phosphoribosyltransferase [Clostridia bacterium]|nr:orotate phosphoribosyltransferase [Clostridia bacterium]